MSVAISNLTMYVGTLPVKVRVREKSIPKEEQKIIEKEHMNGNCNTILCAFIEMNMNGHSAQPSVKYLASLIGGSVRTVIRCLDTLELSGLIKKIRRGCGRTNIYRIGLQLWKRLFVGLKNTFNRIKIKVEDKYLPDKSKYVQPYHPPAPPKPIPTVVSTMEHSAALDFLETNYEEAVKPI